MTYKVWVRCDYGKWHEGAAAYESAAAAEKQAAYTKDKGFGHIHDSQWGGHYGSITDAVAVPAGFPVVATRTR